MAGPPSPQPINIFLAIQAVMLLMEGVTFVFAPLSLAQFGLREASIKEALAQPFVSHLLVPLGATFQLAMAYLAFTAVRSSLYGLKVLTCRVLCIVMLLLLPVNVSMFDLSAVGGPERRSFWDPNQRTLALVNSLMSTLPIAPTLYFAMQSTEDVMGAGAGKRKAQ